MATYISLLRALFFFFSRIFHVHFKIPRYLHKKVNNSLTSSQVNYKQYPSSVESHELFSSDNDYTLIFNVEETLLKSSSLFPYFMLVAFEAGSLLRALLLLILYPFTCLLSKEMRLKLMVFVCFFGIKKDGFIVGKGVLPKFFLEDVGLEGLEIVRKCKRKVGMSNLPYVMIESFLRHYLEIDYVVGKELKDFGGYFIGIMKENKMEVTRDLKSGFGNNEIVGSNVFGVSGTKASLIHPLFSFCKEIYLISEEIKKKWQPLPIENYPKPLIFHDGRLAFKPTPISTLSLFLWLPFGIFLFIIRALIALPLPYKISCPILAFTGMRLLLSISNPSISKSSTKGKLYACNHRTLFDPLCLSLALNKQVTAVTYSLSRVSEILSPIKTVRLTRDRDRDEIMMKKLLNEGDDLVICPEGTTCREPFLLRFSPLFTEMNDQIVPVAINCYVSMFYGTTASGFKWLDPLYFILNPRPSYTTQVLGPVSGCRDRSQSRFDVANHVQREIGETLGFECTKLTRKDKYLILAGNNGVV